MPSYMWKNSLSIRKISSIKVQIPLYFLGYEWSFKFPSSSEKPVFTSWLKEVSEVVCFDGDPGTQNCT